MLPFKVNTAMIALKRVFKITCGYTTHAGNVRINEWQTEPQYAAPPAPSIRLTCCHQRPNPQMYLNKTNRPMQAEQRKTPKWSLAYCWAILDDLWYWVHSNGPCQNLCRNDARNRMCGRSWYCNVIKKHFCIEHRSSGIVQSQFIKAL
jgi:hypothetical protein